MQDYSQNVISFSKNSIGEKILEYAPSGVCSRFITIKVDSNNIVQDVVFFGGCSGNTQGLGALIKGMPAKEAMQRLKGICCGNKTTSCPDQLSNALFEIIKR